MAGAAANGAVHISMVRPCSVNCKLQLHPTWNHVFSVNSNSSPVTSLVGHSYSDPQPGDCLLYFYLRFCILFLPCTLCSHTNIHVSSRIQPRKAPLHRMFRQTLRVARSTRLFSTTSLARNNAPKEFKTAKTLAEVETKFDLIGKGAQPGEVPTDLEQATGLERFELLGKLEGIEVFETEPLDSSRKGTMANPVMIDSYDDYRYVGCTGSPAGAHVVMWLKPTKDKVARCWECGSVYKLNYLGTGEDSHH